METTPFRLHASQVLPVAIIALAPAGALVFAPDYLLFHTLAELFVASVGLVVFSIAWHTRRIATSDYLTFIGMASLPFALVILVHALAYKGMPTFPLHDTDLPTQLWLIARVIYASAFLVAPLFTRRKLRHPNVALACYLGAALVLMGAAMANLLPAAFIEGQGLTPFKVGTEYVVIAATCLSAIGLYVVRRQLNPYVTGMLWFAMGCVVAAELSFTLYTDPFGVWNRIGHVLHVASFIGIYGALVHSSLEAPLSTLFVRLREREADLARAYREEHDIAETLQTAMSVQPTSVEGLDLAHRYLPAKGLGRIGGDFYDLFRIDGSLVGFLIGDVCGKGLRAASTMFRVRSVVRAFALSDPEPSRVLESVNCYLLSDLEDGVFVTAVFGTIDTVTGETLFAVAGHPDPVVCGRPDIVVPPESRATPLGVLEPLAARTQRITLEPGDGFALITDGIIDAPGAAGRFGLERLQDLLHAANVNAGADALLDTVLDAVRSFSRSEENDDDIAMVVLRFSPQQIADETAIAG